MKVKNGKENEKMEKRRFRADIILALLLLFVALSVFLITTLTKKDGAFVRVEIDGSTVATYPLSVDGEYSLNGGTNRLIIKDGRAEIREANCPDGLCIRQGKISYTGERIVCLPNRVMVEVVGRESDTDLTVR